MFKFRISNNIYT